MRKASAALVAVIIGVAGFVACQSADRSPVAPSAQPPAAAGPDGSAQAAADPITLPWKTTPVPVPGKGGSGSTTTVPVPGAPNKGGGGGGGGGGGTPTPGPTPSPTPGLPAAVTVSFTSGDVPKAADLGNPSRIVSTIPVTGITGQLLDVRVAFKATLPNNNPLRLVVLKNPATAIFHAGAALYDFTTENALSGAGIGTGCSSYGTAATFDDDVGVLRMAQSSPPYSGVFVSNPNGTLTSVANSLRTPTDINGDWTLELTLTAGNPGTVDCWSLILVYQPPAP